jgi:hypothetical protein
MSTGRMRGVTLDPAIEALVKELLGPPDPSEDQYGAIELAATAVALSEIGIAANFGVCSVALDPEEWTRPYILNALHLRGVVYDGMDTYGWDAIFEKKRKTLKKPCGDYVDKQYTHSVGWDFLIASNTDIGVRADMETTLNAARAVAQNWKIQRKTSKSPAARRGPRL